MLKPSKIPSSRKDTISDVKYSPVQLSVHRVYRFGFVVLSLSLGLVQKLAFQWTQKRKFLLLFKERDRPIFRHIFENGRNENFFIPIAFFWQLSLSYDIDPMQCHLDRIYGHMLVRLSKKIQNKTKSSVKSKRLLFTKLQSAGTLALKLRWQTSGPSSKRKTLSSRSERLDPCDKRSFIQGSESKRQCLA